MAAHAISSGAITFGLVSVPVKLYVATQSQSVSFNLLHAKDQSRLRQQYACTTCGAIVDRSDMVRGYEYAKDQYVVFSDADLRTLEQSTDQSIEIQEFVPIAQVDPIYFEKTWPGQGRPQGIPALARGDGQGRASRGGEVLDARAGDRPDGGFESQPRLETAAARAAGSPCSCRLAQACSGQRQASGHA